jgi:hypothetical protein
MKYFIEVKNATGDWEPVDEEGSEDFAEIELIIQQLLKNNKGHLNKSMLKVVKK